MNEAQTAVARRARRNRAEADQVAAEYEASGLRREEFCQLRGIPRNTLARYVARRRREQCGEAPAQRWVAVEVAEPPKPVAALRVVLASGRRVEVGAGFDAETLQRLVRTLERS